MPPLEKHLGFFAAFSKCQKKEPKSSPKKCPKIHSFARKTMNDATPARRQPNKSLHQNVDILGM
jgi:hypothetical protein